MIAQENQRSSECNQENRDGAGFLEFFSMAHPLEISYPSISGMPDDQGHPEL